MKYFLAALFVIVSPLVAAQENALSFNPESGFYTDSVEVIINSAVSGEIYYTLDGSIPDSSDQKYNSAIVLNKTRVLRAILYSDELPDSVAHTSTYFINEETTLPVVSISTNPENFFSNETGIYVEGTNGITGYCSNSPRNWNQDWERPVYLSYFGEDKENKFNINAGVKIGGGCTRLYDEKSLDIYFRSQYGESKLRYHLFEDKDIDTFNRLSLRSGGQDWYRAIIRNSALQTITRNSMDLGFQSYKMVIVFLNGEYWGIHILREKQNEDFLESNYGFDADSIDILKLNQEIKEGSADHYKNMIDFIKNNDLSVKENYEWVGTQMDIDQYIDYQIAEIFFANGDWPGGNIIYWKPQKPGAKWRWLMYDLDMGFGSHSYGEYDTNSLELASSETEVYYANPTWSTFLFRNLLKNEEFRNEFMQRYNIHMVSTFDKDRMLGIIDSLQTIIEPEIPRHKQRWPKALSLGGKTYEQHKQIIEQFATSRTSFARSHLYNFFGQEGAKKLTVNVEPAGAGHILVHGIIAENLKTGVPLFPDVPARAEAKAMSGYTFAGWSGVTDITDESIHFTITDNSTLTAHFKVADSPDAHSPIVINEVNYRSADDFDPEDWVEFYNKADSTVDMSGWYFSDSDAGHKFFFPNGFKLDSHQYIVITRDKSLFKALFPDVTNYIGDMDFGLSGDGEFISLMDRNGTIIDSLTYNDKAPWPEEADGEGATLQLKDPVMDNSMGSNWVASADHGTPGIINTIPVSIENEEITSPKVFVLYQNYPNPFNPSTTITYILERETMVTLSIFDVTGKKLATLINKKQSAGPHQTTWNAGQSVISSGIYFYKLNANGESEIKKMILIK